MAREEPMSDTQKTVKVRIAVAVTPEGDWYAAGHTGQTDGWIKAKAWREIGGGNDVRISIVTAEVPLPETVEIEAEVENANG